MANIHDLSRRISRDLSPEFEKRLHAALAEQDREWLVNELVGLVLGHHQMADLEADGAATALRRTERLQRVAMLKLDESAVKRFISDNEGRDRDRLIAEGYLNADAPKKGTAMLGDEHRTPQGSSLLIGAKDMLFGLLFGDDRTGTWLDRIQQELLTLALPRAKAGALDFMRASTELAAAGTWQDPESVSNDERADNVLLEVQFGETADELVGRGIVTALSLINSLEVNEQILYARMINVEESTLIP